MHTYTNSAVPVSMYTEYNNSTVVVVLDKYFFLQKDAACANQTCWQQKRRRASIHTYLIWYAQQSSGFESGCGLVFVAADPEITPQLSYYGMHSVSFTSSAAYDFFAAAYNDIVYIYAYFRNAFINGFPCIRAEGATGTAGAIQAVYDAYYYHVRRKRAIRKASSWNL